MRSQASNTKVIVENLLCQIQGKGWLK